jgi:NitT/TauT family transport system ATP-binding protein
VRALEDVSLDAAPGEFVSIVGPSGCGKTTLLKLVAGLLTPSAGTVELRGGPDGRRPRPALVFQDHGLFPWLTVRDNVAFGLEMQGVPRRARHEAARVLLARFGLAAFTDRYPGQLSAGMCQLVALARALAVAPPVLLLDEPFGALDAQTRLVLQGELLRAWEEHGMLILHVTHDIEEAVLLADRVIVMTGRPGRVRAVLGVPAARPRDVTAAADPELVALRWKIWGMLEPDARDRLREAP